MKSVLCIFGGLLLLAGTATLSADPQNPKDQSFEVQRLKTDLKLLQEHLKDADPKKRRSAAAILAALAEEVHAVGSELDDAFDGQDQSEETILALINAVKAMGPSSARPPIGTNLPPYLRHKNPEVRLAAASAIQAVNRWQVASNLVPLLKDSDVRVRRQAAASLAFFAPRDHAAVPVLIETLRNPREDLYVREQAATALGKMGPWAKSAVPALTETFKNPENDRSLRAGALFSIAQLSPGDKTTIAWFIELLGDKQDFLNRYAAIGALKQMGPEARTAVPALLVALHAQDVKPPQLADNTRRQVVGALAAIGPDAKEAVPDLVGMLKNKELHYSPRSGVAWALGEIGPAAKAAIPALRDAAKPEEDAVVRVAATDALRKIDP